MRIKSKESLQQAVIFTMTWHCMNLNPGVSEGDDDYRKTFLVYVAKLSSPSTRSETIIAACSCLQHYIKGFLCRHIVRCAVLFPELVIRSRIVNDIIGSRMPFELFFEPYWKSNVE